MSTLNSSAPMLLADGYGTGMPRVFIAATTMVTSAVADTGRWIGAGAGSRSGASPGLQLGDLLCHISSTGAAAAGKVSWHSVIGNTIDQATTSASSAYNYAYNATVSVSS